MNADSAIDDDLGVTGPARSLAALARISFPSLDPSEILATATDGAEALCECRVEASYWVDHDVTKLSPPTQDERPELTELLVRSSWEGEVPLDRGQWGRALPLSHRNVVHGCLVLSAPTAPTPDRLLLLDVLGKRAGAALACAELHQRDVRRARQLEESNEHLANAVERLQARTRVHELLEAAVTAGSGVEGVADVLHRLTGCSVCVEDRFGNLLAWAGPGRPSRYSKPTPRQRESFLRSLSTESLPMRTDDRICVPIRLHSEILGVVALVEAGDGADESRLFALRYGSSVLGLEFSHRRRLAEMQTNLRRELVDELLAGTDADGAYARAEAMGHDLRRPHHVVVIHTGRGASAADTAGICRAAMKLSLNHLVGQQGNAIVLLADGRPSGEVLHREVSRQLGHSTSAIGIGPRCDVPADFPQAFRKAHRAMDIRLNSAQPHGTSDYEDLGFYHLVDAANTVGVADEYVRQWLGALIDYDAAKNSDLLHTLSHYLECGGNYDESAAALHVHRSTLRYRLSRIAELTGMDLRDVDTRFNLHAATRVWRFLTPES